MVSVINNEIMSKGEMNTCNQIDQGGHSMNEPGLIGYISPLPQKTSVTLVVCNSMYAFVFSTE